MSERTLMDVLTEAHDRHSGVSRMLISYLCKPQPVAISQPLVRGEEFGPAWQEENKLDIIRAREQHAQANAKPEETTDTDEESWEGRYGQ